MQEILLFVVGIVVGAMNAIAGGGMLLGFPVLLAAGIPPIIANASTGIVTLPGQISSALYSRKYLRETPRKYLLLVVPLAVGSLIGAILLSNTDSAQFDKVVPALVIIAVALFAFQPFLYNYMHKHIHGPVHYRNKYYPLIIMGLALLPVAIYGSYFGAGIGFIMLAFLGFTRIHEMHRMNVLKSLGCITILATSLPIYIASGMIDWHAGLFMGSGALVGGWAGAHFSQRFSSHAIRIVVIAIGITAASYIAFKAYY